MFGPLDGPITVSNTFATINFIMWCLHAKLIRSLPSFSTRSTQAPAWTPVLLAVVSKHTNLLRSVRFHSWMRLNTAVAYACPFPYGNLGTPNNFIVPSPDTRTARRSNSSFVVKAGNILPSQCTVNGQFGSKDAWISLAAISRSLHLALLIDSLLMARAKGLCPSDCAAAAMMYVAFL